MNIKLDNNLYQKLLNEATESPRKRSHFNLHKSFDEPVQRLCIALKKGTYVKPHYHPNSNKWELMLALKGESTLIIFDKDGVVLERLTLSPNNSMSGIELKPDTWHTVFPQSSESVILEVKEGPYTPSVKSDFANWAPDEGDANVNEFLQWLESAGVGGKYASKL